MLQTTEKPELAPSDMGDEDAIPPDELRSRLYRIASEARLIGLAARAINKDDGAAGVDDADPDTAYAIERAAERIEERLLALAGGFALDRLKREAVAS